ncbi:MAG TPA: SpoIIE family protein phosphatase [Phycisphaerales bacterium]|nr:SpoIIE family protein phosphatase [Phycisphaerales bacterium]
MATSHSMPGSSGVGPGSAAMAALPRLVLDAVSGPPLPAINPAPDKPTVLGRSNTCDVVLGDESVSRKHCAISARQGTWFIEDLGSRHGTYINAAKLSNGENTTLKNGDMVGIGPWLLRVRLGTAAAASAMQRVVTLVDPGSTVGAPKSAGSAGASSILRERVERVQERELAAMNQNRLKLLIDVAAAVAGTSDEEALAKMIVHAAVQGTGFPRAYLLRDETLGAPAADGEPASEGGTDTLRVIYEIDPDSPPPAAGAAETAPRPVQPAANGATPAFSRSLIAAARKGEVVRLTGGADTPMQQAQSIRALGIQTALCVPITIGSGVAGFLYLDARAGEKSIPRIPGQPAAPQTVSPHHDSAAFCSALAKMYSLALSNISRHELEKRQRELVRDMEAAGEAQRLIMPPSSGTIGRLRYAMRSKSGRYVAGDLFDVVDLGEENGIRQVGVLLGDVSGKGVPAAILMATAQTHLHVALSEGKDPARAVRAVNAHICKHMASNKFISLWCGVFTIHPNGGGTLAYVDAGHGYWLLTRDGRPPLRNESATSIPLGIDPTGEFEAVTVRLTPGQRVIVFSDGVVEQPAGAGSDSGPAGMFGVEGAIKAIVGSTHEQSDVDRIFDAVLKHAAGPNLADDTTVASVALL